MSKYVMSACYKRYFYDDERTRNEQAYDFGIHLLNILKLNGDCTGFPMTE